MKEDSQLQTKVYLLLGALLAGRLTPIAYAQDASLLELEARGILEGDTTVIFSVVVIVLLVGIGLISLWSYSNYLNRERGHTVVHPRVENLYFGFRYQLGSEQDLLHKGYLISLGVRTASFIAESSFRKGQRIYLHLDSFPNFASTGEATHLAAEVIRVKKVRGDVSTQEVSVKFVEVPKALQHDLASYLRSLTSHQLHLQQV